MVKYKVYGVFQSRPAAATVESALKKRFTRKSGYRMKIKRSKRTGSYGLLIGRSSRHKRR